MTDELTEGFHMLRLPTSPLPPWPPLGSDMQKDDAGQLPPIKHVSEDEEMEAYARLLNTFCKLAHDRFKEEDLDCDTRYEDPCPSCGQAVQWHINSYNRHLAAKCTGDCFSFME